MIVFFCPFLIVSNSSGVNLFFQSLKYLFKIVLGILLIRFLTDAILLVLSSSVGFFFDLTALPLSTFGVSSIGSSGFSSFIFGFISSSTGFSGINFNLIVFPLGFIVFFPSGPLTTSYSS